MTCVIWYRTTESLVGTNMTRDHTTTEQKSREERGNSVRQ